MFPTNNIPNTQQPPSSKLSSIKNIFTGGVGKLLSLPDKHPKVRIVFDITIIALAVIAMVALILTSGVSGPMFFAIVPLMAFAGLGLALLISDTVKNKKVQHIAEKIAAFTVPLIILSSGVAFIAAGYLAIPTSAAFLGTPQFILGLLISGLAIVALKKITIPKLIAKKPHKKTAHAETRITSSPKTNTGSIKTTTVIQNRKKNQMNQARKSLIQQNNSRRKPYRKITAVRTINSGRLNKR